MVNELKCTISKIELPWRNNKLIDCTFVEQQTIYNKDVDLIYDKHGASTEIRFDSCIMLTIPSAESIKKFIPNLTVLSIRYSKLSTITSEDFKGFNCLRDLYIEDCEIEYLPGNLFEHTPFLEMVSFFGNKIKYIDEGILVPLQNLKIFCLWSNVNIDVAYDILNNTGNVTLAQLKNEIKTKCSRIDLKKQQKEVATLKANEKVQKKENAELKRKYEEISGKFEKLSSEHENLKKLCSGQTKLDVLRGKNYELEKKFESLSREFQVIKQVSKNLTIKIKENLFMVHKAVLIAHSPVFAKLIAENPEADSLELKDISEATFQEILNFMNDGSEPSENANVVELFGSSCRLEIHALTAIVAEVLKEVVNEVNALDVLVICNKFDKLNRFDELKMKAFAEFKKNFPNQVIMPELASKPEKLKKIMQIKLEMDKVVAEMHQVD